jgi:hypothetical protein
MPRRVSLLHVRKTLEWIEDTTTSMIERDGKHQNGLRLAPIDQTNLRQIRLVVRAILRKHAEKKTRKDVYVECTR